MKKFLIGTAITAGMILAGSLSVFADDITVKVANSELDFDQPPVVVEGRTLVPFRAIFEALGADVEWDAENREVTGTRGSTVVTMTIDEPEMTVNSETVELDVPAQIINSRTMVPVRAVSDGLDETVKWDADTKTVEITTSLLEEGDISELTINPSWLDEAGAKVVTFDPDNGAFTFSSQVFDINPETGKEDYYDVYATMNTAVVDVIHGEEAKAIAREHGTLDVDKFESKVRNTFGSAKWVAVDAVVYPISEDTGYSWWSHYTDADIDLRNMGTSFGKPFSADECRLDTYELLYNGEYYNLAYSKKNGDFHTVSVYCLPEDYDNMIFIHTGCDERNTTVRDTINMLLEKGLDGGAMWMPLKSNEEISERFWS